MAMHEVLYVYYFILIATQKSSYYHYFSLIHEWGLECLPHPTTTSGKNKGETTSLSIQSPKATSILQGYYKYLTS